MPVFIPAIAHWFRTHHGVADRATLRALGLSPSSIKTLVNTGELILVYEGVYRSASWPDTFLSRCVAMCAADLRVVICCGGAARLWVYRGCAALGLHVTTTASGLPFGGDIVIHRCSNLPSDHVHVRPDGIRVTSPARTVFDLARHVDATTLESIIEQGLNRRQFDVLTLYGMGRLLCRSGRDGSNLFAQVLTSRPTWRRPVDSHPELVLLNELARHGVHLTTQVALELPGQTIHPDLGDAEHGFFIEVDDHEWHGGRLAGTYDVKRDRQARLQGARVERVSTDEIAEMSPAMVADLVAAYRQHRSLSQRSA